VLKPLYDTFLQERRFLKNCSPKTLRSYGQAWSAFESTLAPVTNVADVRAAVKAGVLAMMSDGKRKPSSINVYLRAMNAFLRWGSIEEHFKPPIKSVALLKTPTKVISTLSETQVQHIVQFKPTCRKERRVRPGRSPAGVVTLGLLPKLRAPILRSWPSRVRRSSHSSAWFC
jgi:site-specific recombinase XerD